MRLYRRRVILPAAAAFLVHLIINGTPLAGVALTVLVALELVSIKLTRDRDRRQSKL
jgi:hypothetical protein